MSCQRQISLWLKKVKILVLFCDFTLINNKNKII
jgi:hypothetical protein